MLLHIGGELIENKKYEELIKSIGSVYAISKNKVVSTVNVEMLNANWEIGIYIVEFEQKGEIKAEYGKELLI